VLLISPTARVSPLSDIEDSRRGTRIEVGDDTVIDSFVKIKPAGGDGDVVIGASSYINSGTVIYSGNGVRIGKGVLIAANCTFAPVNHEYSSRQRTILSQRFRPSKGGIVVEDDVWIGANCVLLDGTRVKQGAVIGAGSILSGIFDEYGVYGGVPPRLIKYRQ
jgi:virginiamycin A acetyltransferase